VPTCEKIERFINFKILIATEGKTIQTIKAAFNPDKMLR
jgi:hypothetical protein